MPIEEARVPARDAATFIASPDAPTAGGEPQAVGSPAAEDALMALAWDVNRRPGLQALLAELQQDKNRPAWNETDLKSWLLDDQEKAETTVNDWLRHARFMETYPAQPVHLRGTRYQFVLSGRLFYHVRKEAGTGYGGLAKDLKVLRTIGRFLGVPREVWPVSPPAVQRQREHVPTPEEVHALLHTDYTRNAKRSIENAWVRHVLAMHFGLGLRSPKEFWFIQADAFDPKTGILRVVEPKKRHKVRTIYVEPTWLARSRRHLSLAGWMQWRAKLAPVSDRLFPNPLTGRDFASPEAFKQFLDRRVKARFPWFHGYLGRKWCVYARIIDAGFADSAYNQVAEWFGHESADMTRDVYGPAARALSKSPAYGTDWLRRAFQQVRTPQSPKTAREVHSSPDDVSGSDQI